MRAPREPAHPAPLRPRGHRRGPLTAISHVLPTPAGGTQPPPAFHRAPGREQPSAPPLLWAGLGAALATGTLAAPTSAGSAPSALPVPGDGSSVQVAALSPGLCGWSFTGVLAPDTWPAQPILRLTSVFLETLVVPLACPRPLVPLWSHFCVLLPSAGCACLPGTAGRPLGLGPHEPTQCTPRGAPVPRDSSRRRASGRRKSSQPSGAAGSSSRHVPVGQPPTPQLRAASRRRALRPLAHQPFPCRTGAARGPARGSLTLPWPVT